MLDPRIYRAACLPILFVLVVVGFSLREQPRPLTSSLSPDAFDGAAAFRQLDRLASEAPLRRPGSPGDELVARRVREGLAANGFRVAVRRFEAQTVDGRRELTTVVGERAGFSNRRVVVLAHRDALGRGARAELSGTAALLELARVLGGRTLGRTFVLASTSGGTAGLAAARELARELGGDDPSARIDAVLVLGDLAGRQLRRPLVVPWSESDAIAPLALRRTVEAAVAAEVGTRVGRVRPGVQLARLAFPLTPGEQGPFNARGVGAVLLSASGELPPAADAPVSQERLTAFGRAALRTVGALDAGADLPPSGSYLTLERKLLPAWAVRLLALALVAPVLLAAIDALARARRRREPVARWLGWLAVGVLPFALAVAAVAAMARAGLLDAPGSPPVGAAARPRPAALAGALAVLALGWWALRPWLLRRLGLPRRPGALQPGAAPVVALTLAAAALVVWAGNPYACLLLVPALHLWLVATASEAPPRRPLALALWALGVAPPLLVAFAYARQLALDPLELASLGAALVAGGDLGWAAVALWCVVAACGAAALTIAWRASGPLPPEELPPITVRGPATYAGPGSLGGTESALRR